MSANKRLICIKVGGGVITDKSKPMTINTAALNLCASEISKAWHKHKDSADFILGNGAGSFGHFLAHEYDLGQGAKDFRQFFGVGLTHNAVKQLNLDFVSRLHSHKLPAYSVSPGDMMHIGSGRLDSMHRLLILDLLNNGCIPVLHGDTIIDHNNGTTIYSTEKALFSCAQDIGQRYQEVVVIEIVASGGVLTKDGKLISELNHNQKVEVTSSHDHDVTGGIISKVKSARDANQWASKVYFIGPREGELTSLLSGRHVGTRIL